MITPFDVTGDFLTLHFDGFHELSKRSYIIFTTLCRFAGRSRVRVRQGNVVHFFGALDGAANATVFVCRSAHLQPLYATLMVR